MKEIITNHTGLSFEVEKEFVEKDDFGNPVHEYCISEYDTAKIILYQNASELLPLEEEKVEIQNIIDAGIHNFLNPKFNA